VEKSLTQSLKQPEGACEGLVLQQRIRPRKCSIISGSHDFIFPNQIHVHIQSTPRASISGWPPPQKKRKRRKERKKLRNKERKDYADSDESVWSRKSILQNGCIMLLLLAAAAIYDEDEVPRGSIPAALWRHPTVAPTSIDRHGGRQMINYVNDLANDAASLRESYRIPGKILERTLSSDTLSTNSQSKESLSGLEHRERIPLRILHASPGDGAFLPLCWRIAPRILENPQMVSKYSKGVSKWMHRGTWSIFASIREDSCLGFQTKRSEDSSSHTTTNNNNSNNSNKTDQISVLITGQRIVKQFENSWEESSPGESR